MYIGTQRLGDRSIAHDDERNAVGQAPFFVRTAGKQIKRAPVGVVIERHNRDAGVMVERFKNRCGSCALGNARARGTDFQLYRPCADDRHAVGTNAPLKLQRCIVMPVARRVQCDYKTCVRKKRACHQITTRRRRLQSSPGDRTSIEPSWNELFRYCFDALHGGRDEAPSGAAVRWRAERSYSAR